MADPAWAGDPTPKGSSRKSSSAIPQVAAIDKGIAEGWAAAGVKPAASAKDEEFLRRVYLDLLGRIPTVQEARAFLGMKEADRRGTPSTPWFVALRSLRWYALNLVGGACLFWVTPRLVAMLGGIDLRFASAVIFTAFQAQHFFVDGVIWKLRSRSVGSPLLVHVPALFRPAPAQVLA